ncbi:MAG TPA: NAD(P)H-dependent oxidoreductase [Niabella sp.]|nr:NAD(P)H-dependent oxidoreductase [Niabella sp.]HUN04436.1 NAD(P)H-dependent oxidoreductase [Niabella sp.]
MKVLILNGSIFNDSRSAGNKISDFVAANLRQKGLEIDIFNVSTAEIPMLDGEKMKAAPLVVTRMCEAFQSADLHLWLAPLYHGSIPGVMKNCLGWLEITSKMKKPYLTDKTIGLICWADGAKALDGIYTMNSIAHALRAWVVPYTVSISTEDLFENGEARKISNRYKNKLEQLTDIAVSRKIEIQE